MTDFHYPSFKIQDAIMFIIFIDWQWQIDVNNLSELLKFNIEFDYAINLVTDSRNSPKLNKIILHKKWY